MAGCSDAEADLVRQECTALMWRMKGTKGIGKARAALAKATNRSESAYETLLRLILQEHGITCHAQVSIGPYRVDLLAGDVIIEIDGRVKYAKQPEDVVLKQLEREDWLREQGFKVLRVRTGEIDRNEVEVVRRVLDKLEEESRPLREQPRLYEPRGPRRQQLFPQALAEQLGRKW